MYGAYATHGVSGNKTSMEIYHRNSVLGQVQVHRGIGGFSWSHRFPRTSGTESKDLLELLNGNCVGRPKQLAILHLGSSNKKHSRHHAPAEGFPLRTATANARWRDAGRLRPWV